MVNNKRVAQNVSVDVFEVSEVLPVLNESKHFLILGIFKEEENKIFLACLLEFERPKLSLEGMDFPLKICQLLAATNMIFL